MPRQMRCYAALVSTLWLLSCVRHASSFVYEIKASQLTEGVLQQSNVVIVGLKDKLAEEEMRDLERTVKGLVDVAVMETEAILSAFNKLEQDVEGLPNATRLVVFPYGIPKYKLRKWQGCNTVKEARRAAFEAIPDHTISLPSNLAVTTDQLKLFLEQSLQHFPPRFPVVLFTDRKTTSALFKSLTLQLSTLFHFGVMRDPDIATKALFGVRSLPHLAIIMTEINSDGTPRLRTISYDPLKNGKLSYPTILRFLYISHKKFFEKLPRADDAIRADAIDLEEILEKRMAPFQDELLRTTPGLKEEYLKEEQQRSVDSTFVDWATEDDYKLCQFQKADVCVFMLRAKNYKMTKEDKTVPNDLQIVIAAVRNWDQTVLAFSFVGRCYRELLDEFALSEEDMPAVLVINAKKRTFAVSASVTDNAVSFFKMAMTGNLPQRKFTKLPYLRKANECKAIRSNASERKTEL